MYLSPWPPLWYLASRFVWLSTDKICRAKKSSDFFGSSLPVRKPKTSDFFEVKFRCLVWKVRMFEAEKSGVLPFPAAFSPSFCANFRLFQCLVISRMRKNGIESPFCGNRSRGLFNGNCQKILRHMPKCTSVSPSSDPLILLFGALNPGFIFAMHQRNE